MANDVNLKHRKSRKRSAALVRRTVAPPARIAFVGVSFREGLKALDGRSISGALIDEIADGLLGVKSLRTNLIDKVLVDTDGRLRNPTSEEISICWDGFEKRIQRLRPRVVVPLGAIAAKAILTRMAGVSFDGWAGRLRYAPVEFDGTAFIAAHHPAHIAVYRRGDRSAYVAALKACIMQVFLGENRV